MSDIINLDDLPKWTDGSRYYGNIKWSECIGHDVRFNYYGEKGVLRIIGYNPQKREVHILYKNKEYSMKARHFKNGHLGSIIKNITSEFKIKIGTRIKDFDRDLTIIDRKKETRIDRKKKERTDKLYRYECNKCGFSCGENYSTKTREKMSDYWVEESNLIRGKSGCACCSNPAHVVVPEINSVAKKYPELVFFFQNGVKEAEKYTEYSEERIYPVCPYCNQIKRKPIMISKLVRDHCISCPCTDKISFPEKILYFLLEYLNIDFEYQVSRVNYSWCGRYKYDFGFKLDEELIIIETHGIQHYKSSNRGRSLNQEQDNDKAKKNVAIKNGIKKRNYIVIDCRLSEFEYIKNNILRSRLGELYDLTKVEWNHIYKRAYSNLVKLACEYKRNNESLSTNDIGRIMKLDKTTIARYLREGTKYGWCNYDPELERRRGILKSSENNRRNLSYKVIVFSDNNEKIGEFESAKELAEKSMEKYGIVLSKSRIQYACRNKNKYKGLFFMYDRR